MGKATEVLIHIKDKIDLRGMKKLQARLGKVQTSIKKAFNSAPVRGFNFGVLAGAAALAKATVEAVRFNVQMARAWTMSSKGSGWFKDMREQVRALSAELGIAKDQISKGLYQALSAGVPEKNVMEFLRTAAKIAVADGSDVATVVDGLTTVLNAFKIDAAETDAVADQLFNTVANGKTTFGELAQTLSTVAPLAAANGIALNEVLAAVATLTKQGTPTAQAMTQIRAAIIGANKALGDGWSKTMSLQDAFVQIERQSGGSQKALMKMVGSVEALQAILGLSGQNARMAADDLKATGDAAGKVAEAFKKVDQFRHWEKLWKSIGGIVERVAQEADSRLAPAIMEMVEGLASIQQDGDLWSGLGDTLDQAMENVTAIFDYIHTNGAGGAKEVVNSLGLLLIGHAQNGAEEAVKILAKWVPILGYELGAAAKDAVLKFNQDDPDTRRKVEIRDQALDEKPGWDNWISGETARREKELMALEKQKNRRQRLGTHGDLLAANIAQGGGNKNIAAGRDSLAKITDREPGVAAMPPHGYAEVNGRRIDLPKAGTAEFAGQSFELGNPDRDNEAAEAADKVAEAAGKATEASVKLADGASAHMETIKTAMDSVAVQTAGADQNLKNLADVMDVSIEGQVVHNKKIKKLQSDVRRLELLIATLR